MYKAHWYLALIRASTVMRILIIGLVDGYETLNFAARNFVWMLKLRQTALSLVGIVVRMIAIIDF